MAKSKSKPKGDPNDVRHVPIRTREEAEEALAEMEKIAAEIEPKMRRANDLKTAVTQFAIKKKVGVFQFDEHHYQLITRSNTGWDVAKLKKIVKNVKVDGKKLWNLITVRQLDTDLLDAAVKQGWISEDAIEPAWTETKGAPFLQKYRGRANK